MKNRVQIAVVFALLGSTLFSLAGSGSVAWRHTLDSGAPDEGMGVRTDAAGNVYAAAMTYLAPRASLLLAKLNASGDEQWRTLLPVTTAGPPRSGSCRIAVAGEDTYVVCHEDSADHGAFVARCRADGSVAWSETITDISWPQAFESDGTAVYLMGTNSAGQLALKKFEAAGLSWTVPVTNAIAAGRAMAANRLVIQGNDVLVTGWQETDELDYQTAHQTNQVTAAFALRCGVDGTLRWQRTVNSTNRLNTRGNGIAQTSAGDIVIGGVQSRHDTNGFTELLDNIFVRFDENGNEITRTTLPRAGIISVVLPLMTGDVLTLGADPFPNRLRVARTSSNGSVQWIRVIAVTRSDAAVGRFLDGNQLLLGGYDNGARSLYRFQLDVETAKGRIKRLPFPSGVSRNPGERRDFGLDAEGNLYFLTGDGTPWPDVVLVKYRGSPR